MSMRTLTIAGFVALAVAAGVLYAAGRARRFGLAPLGDVVDALRSRTLTRVLLAAVWVWVGWHLLAR